MASKSKLENLDLTSDEIDRLTKALKNEEFRKMFVEYAQEISDPENRARYEAEIAQMENERGMDVKFVNPEPGYVIKTTVNGEKKAFINICQNEHIEAPTSEKKRGPDGKAGLAWSIPHSFSPPREDIDKNGKKCTVYDVVFSPDTYRMAERNERFKKLIHDTAFEGIERQFDVKLDKKNFKFPKIKFKGQPVATVIRSRKNDEDSDSKKEMSCDPNDPLGSFPYPYTNETTEEKMAKREAEISKRETSKKEKESKTKQPKKTAPKEDAPVEPKYTIVHRSDMDLQEYRNAPDAKTTTRPKELILNIDLPLLKSAAPVNLDIFERRLVLESTTPAAYKLDVSLPYPVDEDGGSAKFDKEKRRLKVTLPVIPAETPSLPSFIDTPGDGGEAETLENGPKPLIEVLSEKENESNEDANSNNDASLKPVETNVKQPNSDSISNENDKEIWTEKDVNPNTPPPKIYHSMPDFKFNQDEINVSIVLNIKNVDRSSVTKSYTSAPSGCLLKCVSVGSGGFPIHYSFCIQFSDHQSILPNQCRVDVSDENVVLLLKKDKSCLGFWDKFSAGKDVENLEEKLFLTESNLEAELDKLEAEATTTTLESEETPELEVTEMNEDKLTVEIKPPVDPDAFCRRNNRKESESSDVEVVFDRDRPKLHSILKQRSISESSADDLSASYGREHVFSYNSESAISESEENGDGSPRMKKSVSFSDHIDSTNYRPGMAVTNFHNTLKNKKRRMRKKEQKHGRRRHHSSTSEHSSSENEGHHEDLLQQQKRDEEKAESSEVSKHNETQGNQVPSVGMNGDKESVEERTVNDIESESISNKAIRSIPKDGLELKHEKEKSKFKVKVTKSKGDDSDDDADDVVLESNNNEHKSLITEVEQGDAEAEKPVKVDTVLSWEEGKKDDIHKTKCAFDFSNTVMYDLDEE